MVVGFAMGNGDLVGRPSLSSLLVCAKSRIVTLPEEFVAVLRSTTDERACNLDFAAQAGTCPGTVVLNVSLVP
jgi:hypothetical protein